MHKISWLNQPDYNGESFNPIRARLKDGPNVICWIAKTGTHCEKVGPGCANCYAERHNGRCLPGGGTGLPYTRASRDKVEIYLDRDKLDKVRRWRKPRCIFWCSLTDLFGEWVPDEMLHMCLKVMANTPQHRHIILTKRPERAAGWNVGAAWLLASASTQTDAMNAANSIRHSRAPVVGLSLEPLLEPITICKEYLQLHEWTIVGCESGPRRRPCELEWVRSIIEQCREAGVSCYVKQVSINGKKSHDPAEWPEDFVQEFPKL